MAKGRMDVIELLRKRGVDADVDFPSETPRVLVDGIMDAEVSARSAPSTANGVLTGSLIAMAIVPALGTPGWAPWTCTSPRPGRAAISRLCWSRDVAVSAPC